ncbi:hypothetical protein MLD38_008994 [Melastoma candidum]|uniref:Uncharacterized protein n=1 Tax=Melastoma candidum TaxID=119954 RepID=A0ACB9S0G2_9MYRT|nr:hypothetical protein MLD38_008994 [Melastoma candidum]
MASRDMSAVRLLVAVTIVLALPAYSSSGRKELRGEEISLVTSNRPHKPLHPDRVDPSRVVQVSWQPRVFVYKGFLSDEECDHLVLLANGKQESTASNEVWVTLLGRDACLIIEIFLALMMNWLERLKKEYQHGHSFQERTAGLCTLNETIATVVLYLSDVTKGGQIHFPKTKVKGESRPSCRNPKGILRPVKGNAILRNRPPIWCLDGDCTDEDDNCPGWAANGECQKNPVYMIGTPDYYGACRKSCNACR